MRETAGYETSSGELVLYGKVLWAVESRESLDRENEPIGIMTEVCRLRLKVPVLERERDVAAGLYRALGTHRGNCGQGDKCLSAREKRY